MTQRENLGQNGKTIVSTAWVSHQKEWYEYVDSHTFSIWFFFQTDGPESLRDQGLEDEVLLKVEKVEEIVLTYVHIAKENEESIVKDETNKLSDYNDDGDDDASESELEKGFK